MTAAMRVEMTVGMPGGCRSAGRRPDRPARLFTASLPARTPASVPTVSTRPALNADSSDSTDPTDRAEATDAADITDAIDSTEPADPMDSTEPADPMDRIEPDEPIDRIEPADPMDRMEPADPTDRPDPAEPPRVWCFIRTSCPARARGAPRMRSPHIECNDEPDATMIGVRAVVSRVSSAAVTVDGQVVGRIDEPGLLALVGVTHTDSADTARRLAAKLHELRILRDDESCATTGAPLLVVSQFTLYARTDKGRRPSWSLAAPGDRAEPLVTEVVEELRRRGAPVQTGVFGATMAVSSVNDGPFTLLVEV